MIVAVFLSATLFGVLTVQVGGFFGRLQCDQRLLNRLEFWPGSYVLFALQARSSMDAHARCCCLVRLCAVALLLSTQ